MEFFEALKTRRSVRRYTSDPVPESVVRECLEAALLAPNSSNLQPWEFYWVRSPEKKSRLAEACMSQPAATTAAELIVCVARTDKVGRNRKLMLEKNLPPQAVSYYEKLVPLVYTQGPLGLLAYLRGAIFFLVGLFRPVPREPHRPSRLREWAVKSTALACENLMLAFRAKGFDSCPMEGMDSVRVKRILGLGRGANIVMVISCGHRAPDGVWGDQIRFDSKLFIHEV